MKKLFTTLCLSVSALCLVAPAGAVAFDTSGGYHAAAFAPDLATPAPVAVATDRGAPVAYGGDPSMSAGCMAGPDCRQRPTGGTPHTQRPFEPHALRTLSAGGLTARDIAYRRTVAS